MKQSLLSMSTMAVAVLAASAAYADFSISKKPTQNMSCSAGVCMPTSVDAVLNVDDLTNLLACGDLTVKTSDDINTPGGIDIVAAVRWNTGARLTLSARRNILVKAPITVAGKGALTIAYGTYNPDSDLLFQKRGRIRFSHLQSQLVINSQSYVLVNTVSGLSTAVAANPSGLFALASDYDAAPDGTYGDAPVDELDGVLNGLGNSIFNVSVEASGKYTRSSPFGINKGTIRDLNLSNVSVNAWTETSSAAGLVSGNYGALNHCSVSGTIEGVPFLMGGLVAHNAPAATITLSRVSAMVHSGHEYAAGLVADNDGAIMQSYATGDVLAHRGLAGGLVSINYGQITEGYFTGTVQGRNVGGLVGTNRAGAKLATSYSTGVVKGSFPGGVIAWDDHGATNSGVYWDLDTSGINNPARGAFHPKNDPGLTGLTDAQLKSGLPDGFNQHVWGSNPNINNGYPYLLANPPQ